MVVNALFFGFFLFFEDLYSHVIYSSVVKYYDTAVGTRFNVYANIFSKRVVAASKIVAYGLSGNVEFVGNTMDRSIG